VRSRDTATGPDNWFELELNDHVALKRQLVSKPAAASLWRAALFRLLAGFGPGRPGSFSKQTDSGERASFLLEISAETQARAPRHTVTRSFFSPWQTYVPLT
jgi:hypothetical protein